MCDDGGLMELPNHCKQCRNASDDCALLYRASKMKKIRKKRFLLKNCPCNDCLMIPICKESCHNLEIYIKAKLFEKRFVIEYFDCKSINWLTRNGV